MNSLWYFTNGGVVNTLWEDGGGLSRSDMKGRDHNWFK